MTEIGHRILLLVPHPDDEVVACAATIARARAAGAMVFALYLTHGCIAQEDMWPWQRAAYRARVAVRYKEADRVARRMGIKPISFSDRPTRSAWRSLPKIVDEVRHAILTHGVDQVWALAYEGGHVDHDAINGVCGLLRGEIDVLEFAAYNNKGGRPRSNAFPEPNGREILVRLTDEEKREKQILLSLYASERGNLRHIKTDYECLRPLAPYDYARPPHEGLLWHKRFWWVPFRHPRVDRTKSEQVSEAIASLGRS